MDNTDINQNMVETAVNIGLPTTNSDLLDAQLSYWLSVQSTIKSGGYKEARKRMPYLSEPLAKAIENSNVKSLISLCSGEISTIRPCLPDETIIEALSPMKGDLTDARIALQLLSENNHKGASL